MPRHDKRGKPAHQKSYPGASNVYVAKSATDSKRNASAPPARPTAAQKLAQHHVSDDSDSEHERNSAYERLLSTFSQSSSQFASLLKKRKLEQTGKNAVAKKRAAQESESEVEAESDDEEEVLELTEAEMKEYKRKNKGNFTVLKRPDDDSDQESQSDASDEQYDDDDSEEFDEDAEEGSDAEQEDASHDEADQEMSVEGEDEEDELSRGQGAELEMHGDASTQHVDSADTYIRHIEHTLSPQEMLSGSASDAGQRKFRVVALPCTVPQTSSAMFDGDESALTELKGRSTLQGADGYGVRKQLADHWLKLAQTPTADKKSKSETGFDATQAAVFPLLNSYRDLWLPSRLDASIETGGNANALRSVYVLHALNHVMKARDIVMRNNTLLSAHTAAAQAKKEAAAAAKKDKSKKPTLAVEEPLPECRDQGFTRARVLILCPFRHSAYKIINELLRLLPKSNRDRVFHQDRFRAEFGPEEGEEDLADGEQHDPSKPDDWNRTFAGNIDDCFRVGLALTNKSVKLFTPFYGSDIIVASPLGLRMIVGSDGDSKREHDFLSSIEMCIIDEADTMGMQNWDHLITVMQAMNKTPEQTHETDFSRVRDAFLNGQSKHFRQTIVMSRCMNAEINGLFNQHCTNFAGRIKLRSTCKGILSQIIPSLRQIFQRVPAQSLATSADERFNYFTKRVLPQIKASPTGGMHTLIFVPSYFDFLRLRKFMREEADMPFAAFSEYDRSAQVTRSRALFFQGRASVMLLTERVTFFKRYKIRGARHFLFYGLPEHEQFYPEFINLVEQGDNSCTVLFNRFDTFALERVVGSERAAKLLQSDKDVHMFC